MSKKFCEFWDSKDKVITSVHDNGKLLCINQCTKNQEVIDRYTPLRCAQHAPMLPDETGKVRQLMEGDVVKGENSGHEHIVYFSDDMLRYMLPNGSSYPLRRLSMDVLSILGNALRNPELVAGWDTLPHWDLLRERVAEWKAAQVVVDPVIERIKQEIGEAQDLVDKAESVSIDAHNRLNAALKSLDELEAK